MLQSRNKRGLALAGATMRKDLKLLFLLIALVVITGLVTLSLAEYTKTGRCYQNGSTLSAEELRERAIRSFLYAQVEETAQINKYKIYAKTFLIRKSLTPNEVIDAIASKSIANIQQEAAYPLKTDRDAASVDSDFLRGEFSVVRYRTGEYVAIFPSNSLQAVDANSARKVFEDMSAHEVGLSLFERALGHGNHVFSIDYYRQINLGCCEEFYRKYPKSDKSREWYTRRDIKAILKGEQPSHYNLVVSNCGEILQRTEESATSGDDIRILF